MLTPIHRAIVCSSFSSLVAKNHRGINTAVQKALQNVLPSSSLKIMIGRFTKEDQIQNLSHLLFRFR